MLFIGSWLQLEVETDLIFLSYLMVILSNKIKLK